MKFPIPKDPSEYMLVAANCLPVVGVLLWGWDAFSVMAVYWLENIIIGVVNVMKMFCVMVVQRKFGGIFLIPFFCFHYGMFTYVHGIFIFMLFTDKHQRLNGRLNADDLHQILSIPGLVIAFVSLAAHQLFSFYFHFLRGGEVKTEKLDMLMGKPYGRIAMLHVTLLLGGALVIWLHNAVWAVLMLTILKIIGELALYQRAHAGTGQTAPAKV